MQGLVRLRRRVRPRPVPDPARARRSRAAATPTATATCWSSTGAACKLYELYDAHPQAAAARWKAGSGADLRPARGDLQRPRGWTSADAAGLPILPGLARYDEVAAGAIAHALRFTAPRTRAAFVSPAQHLASDSRDRALPPMGLRVAPEALGQPAGPAAAGARDRCRDEALRPAAGRQRLALVRQRRAQPALALTTSSTRSTASAGAASKSSRRLAAEGTARHALPVELTSGLGK